MSPSTGRVPIIVNPDYTALHSDMGLYCLLKPFCIKTYDMVISVLIPILLIQEGQLSFTIDSTC